MSGIGKPALKRKLGRFLVALPPYSWLVVFFLLPFLIVLKISLSELQAAIPPYQAIVSWADEGILQLRFNFGNYSYLFSDELYALAYLNSLKVAAFSTLLTLLIGYPMAYTIARAPNRFRNPLLMLVVLPFWTSLLIRVYSWMGILKNEGLLNSFLMWLGIIDSPIQIMETNTAVYIGIVYSYLPFMVLPLYATLEKLDVSLLEAAMDLGARPMRAFWSVTWPLSLPGVVAGSLLVFIPAVGEFIIPTLLGGADTLTISTQLWSEFFANRDWPMASAVTVIMVALLVVPLMLLQRAQARAADGAAS